jgi:hypothetical protein
MEARFGTLRRNTGRSASPTLRPTLEKESFFKREWQQCRTTVWQAGTKYNIIVTSLFSFIATVIILVSFQPMFIMTKHEVTSDPVDYEYLTAPPMPPPPEQARYNISVGSVLMWGAMAAGATALVTYFTCRKKTASSTSAYNSSAYPSTIA